MKSLEDLKRLRDEVKPKVNSRETKDGIRVCVGMATCGIASGARPILNKLVEEVSVKGLDDVTVAQVGCIGECTLEPIVEIFDGEDRYTYCKVTEEVAVAIVEDHIINGKPVADHLIGNYK